MPRDYGAYQNVLSVSFKEKSYHSEPSNNPKTLDNNRKFDNISFIAKRSGDETLNPIKEASLRVRASVV